MTEAVLIVNALAILCGFMDIPVLMYILFGLVWTAFFGTYEKLTWLLYEKVLQNNTNEIIMNVKIVNIIEMISIMILVYLVAYYKKPKLCVVMPTIQMLIKHSIRLYKQQTDRNIIIFVGIVVEFIFSIIVSM